MADVDGYLKDMRGNAIGITGNPIYVTITGTAPGPQEKAFINKGGTIVPEVIYVTEEVKSPKSLAGRIWYWLGKKMGWI